MGRGTIIDEHEGGEYTISLDYGSAQIAEKIATLTALSENYAQAIVEQNALIVPLEAEEATLRSNQDAAIAAYVASADEDERAINKVAMNDATKLLINKVDELEEYRLRVDYYTLNKGNADATLVQLQQVDTTDTRRAWCADYTLAATGEVATIEINAEQPQILIAPDAPTPTAANGVFTSRDVLSPEASFLNVALLPGWQKFSPTFRIGVITALTVEVDLCSVSLVDAASSAQGLNINYKAEYSNVPIEYMTCNAAVFEVGDRVVVQFVGQNKDEPKVIGFESNPRACGEIIAREVWYAPLTGSHNERWAFAFVDNNTSGEFLERLRTADGDAQIGPIDLSVEIKKKDGAWAAMTLDSLATVGNSGGTPGDTRVIQWVWKSSGALPAGEDNFLVTLADTTGEIYQWNPASALRYYIQSYEQTLPLVLQFSTPYDLDWISESYEIRCFRTSDATNYCHLALRRIGLAGPDVAKMNGSIIIDEVAGIPPGTNVRDMTLEVDETLVLST